MKKNYSQSVLILLFASLLLSIFSTVAFAQEPVDYDSWFDYSATSLDVERIDLIESDETIATWANELGIRPNKVRNYIVRKEIRLQGINTRTTEGKEARTELRTLAGDFIYGRDDSAEEFRISERDGVATIVSIAESEPEVEPEVIVTTASEPEAIVTSESDVVITALAEGDSVIDVTGDCRSGGASTADDPNCTIGDYVWEDSNGNGIQDADEAGVAGVTVNLWSSDAVGNPIAIIKTAVTDENGKYLFYNVDLANNHVVEFVIDDLPYTFTATDQGSDDTVDSDADQTTGISSLIAVPNFLSSNINIDAGLIPTQAPLAGLGDYVWIDANHDGIQDSDEIAVQDVPVALWTDDDGDGTPDTQIGETVTDENGYYEFVELDPELTYVVQFPLEVEVDGTTYIITDANQGDDTVDSDADVETGVTAPINLEPGEFNPTIDAGFTELCICTNIITTGSTTIREGDTVELFIETDRAVDYDTFYEVTVQDGSADWVGDERGVDRQDIMWGGMYTIGYSSSYITQRIYDRVPNGTAISTGDRPMVGPGDASWDYSLIQDGAIQNSRTITVRVPAGQTVSEGFEIEAWQELITIDRFIHTEGVDGIEGNETFSVSVTGDDYKCGDGLNFVIKDTSRIDAVSPIALDLNQDGEISRIQGEFSFDITGDGEKENLTEWYAPGEGILIDTRIEGELSGQHLFGDMGGTFNDGFEKLALLDANGDTEISGTELDGLAVWVDNGNAVVDAGEIQTLAQHDVVSIATTHTDYVSSATLADGSTMYTEDVWFEVAP